LNEVDKTSPTSVNGTWTLGGSSTIPTRYGAGLIVNYPTIIYNEYDQSYKSGVGYNYDSYHHYLRFGGNFIEHMGVLPISEGGHYGLVEADGGKVSFACAYYSTAYCPTSSRHKIYSHGDGALYDARTPTSTSNMITGAAISISKPISQFEVTSIIGYIPSGTSIEVDFCPTTVAQHGGMSIQDRPLTSPQQAPVCFGERPSTAPQQPHQSSMELAFNTPLRT